MSKVFEELERLVESRQRDKMNLACWAVIAFAVLYGTVHFIPWLENGFIVLR